MIGIDTNVLVRFLVSDDRVQHARAVALAAKASREGDRMFVSDVVLCETVWVLESCYGVPKAEILDHLSSLLRSRQLAFDDADLLARARATYEHAGGDFADYVILEKALGAGCAAVATFDRDLLKDARFLAL